MFVPKLGNITQLGGDVIESIQAFTVALTGGVTSNTAAINSVDTSRSFIILSGFNYSSTDPEEFARLDLQNATTVRIRSQNTATADTKARGFVIQMKPGVLKSVQRGDIAVSSGNPTGTATITAVNTAKTFVSDLGGSSDLTGTGTINPSSHFATLELTNSTTVTAEYGASPASNRTKSYEVIEFN